MRARAVASVYCLRRTAASPIVAEGVPLFDVGRILWHSALAVTMRYAHFAPAAGRAAIDSLGSALGVPEPARRFA